VVEQNLVQQVKQSKNLENIDWLITTRSCF